MKLLLLVLTGLAALWHSAAQADAPLGSHLAGLLEYAREHNPELAASRYQAAAAAQRAEPAGALPDPVLRTELLDITKQGSTAPRLLPTQVGATRYLLMQSVPWFGKRDLQRAVAGAGAAQANGQVAADWSDLASRIKTAYIQHYYADHAVRLSQQMLVLLDELEQLSQTRYANGLDSQQDALRAQIEKTLLRSELIAQLNASHHSHARLNSLLARPASAPLAEPVQLPALPPAAQLDETALLERLRARNPQLQIATAAIDAADQSRKLTYLSRYPGFTLGVAPTQTASTVKSWDLMVELNIPLQQSSRRAQEQEAEALLAAAHARREALLNQTEAALSESLSELASARQTETLISTQLLPQAELSYQSALAGYQTGKVSFSTLIETQKQILKVRQQSLQAQTDAQMRLAEIEKLLGEE